jgi:hypothetical protein
MNKIQQSKRQRDLHTFVESKYPNAQIKIIKDFPILWSGWEMDNTGWIVSADKTKLLVITNHGQFQIEADASFLVDQQKLYLDTLKDTEEALSLLS